MHNQTMNHYIRAVSQGGTICVIGLLDDSKPVDVKLPLLLGLKTRKNSESSLLLRMIVRT